MNNTVEQKGLLSERIGAAFKTRRLSDDVPQNDPRLRGDRLAAQGASMIAPKPSFLQPIETPAKKYRAAVMTCNASVWRPLLINGNFTRNL
jgi:hypothetical protein